MPEFTSQLQGYENVVAYCYNCELEVLGVLCRLELTS